MLKIEIEKRLTTIIAWGALTITLLITDKLSSDPVNLGKMVVLSFTAGSIITVLFKNRKLLIGSLKVIFLIVIGFLVICLSSIIFSPNPWEKGFYGTFGRNTGFLTYLSFSIIFLAAALLRRQENFIRVIRMLLVAGLLNIVYCIAAIQGYDIFTWKNPYGKALGTFGNPNFISSFLAIFITCLLAFFFAAKVKFHYRLVILGIIASAVYVILRTGSQQGIVLFAGGIIIILLVYFRSRVEALWANLALAVGAITAGSLTILGMLQIGPLTSLIYKPSVSLRGEYWNAGLNMGFAHPYLGVGLDSYGTFYRTFRNESATVFPGINTGSDAAHNVYIDIFAGTGLIGVILYVALVLIILFKAIQFLKTNRTYDPIFVSLFATWICFQAQSVISINQIGLGIWGWVLSGCLYSYVELNKSASVGEKNFILTELWIRKKIPNNTEVPAGIAVSSFISGVIFLTMALPSFYVDAKLRSAVSANTVDALYLAAKQWPLDSNRLNFAVSQLSKGSLNQQTVDLINLGLEKFPNDFGLLFSKYQISIPNSTEWKELKKRLNLADPFNPLFFENR